MAGRAVTTDRAAWARLTNPAVVFGPVYGAAFMSQRIVCVGHGGAVEVTVEPIGFPVGTSIGRIWVVDERDVRVEYPLGRAACPACGAAIPVALKGGESDD